MSGNANHDQFDATRSTLIIASPGHNPSEMINRGLCLSISAGIIWAMAAKSTGETCAWTCAPSILIPFSACATRSDGFALRPP